jgi:hypothetical protein
MSRYTDYLTKENNDQARLNRAYKKYNHEKWIRRQEEYHKMIESDSYGIKKNKVQNLGRTEKSCVGI